MSKIKNGGLDQYGAEPFKQEQFRTADVEGVKTVYKNYSCRINALTHKKINHN